MKKILFICTGNTCRSPMAEGLFQKMLSENPELDAKCSSAGISAVKGQKVTPWAAEVCREVGVDISKHRARCLTMEMMEKWDLLVVMTPDQRMLLAEAGIPEEKLILLDVEDPYGGPIESYRQCRDLLTQRLQERVLVREPVEP